MESNLRHLLKLSSFSLSDEEEKAILSATQISIDQILKSGLHVSPKPVEADEIASVLTVKSEGFLDTSSIEQEQLDNDPLLTKLGLPILKYFLEECGRKERELAELKEATSESLNYPKNLYELIQWFFAQYQVKVFDEWPELTRADLRRFSSWVDEEENKTADSNGEYYENPMQWPERTSNEIAGLYDFLKDKEWIDAEWKNFEAIFSGEDFECRINWYGKKTDLKRVLMWVHGNKKKFETGKDIPYNKYGRECFSNLKNPKKGLGNSVKPISGPEKRKLEEFISKYNSS